jgi:hypothetical protein
VFAVVSPGAVVPNLVAGAIAEAGAQQAGDLMQASAYVVVCIMLLLHFSFFRALLQMLLHIRLQALGRQVKLSA